MGHGQYRWRSLTTAERREVLAWRKRERLPWHSPPHRVDDGHSIYHLAASCFDHRPHIGYSPERMNGFSHSLLEVLRKNCEQIYAWCVLPNHYHALVQANEVRGLLHDVGLFHGRTSYSWNGEEHARGRKVFFRSAERAIRSDRHFWASMNYVHHNPVHHGYVALWTDWPWSSAQDYLERIGGENAARIWREYPVLDFGKGWDEPSL